MHPPVSPTSWLEISLPADEATQEILIAELAELGYDSFWQDEASLKAYIWAEAFDAAALAAVCAPLGLATPEPLPQPDINWNARWEAEWQPVAVGRFVYIHPQHLPPDPAFRLNLCIQPQMAFGTGHHATTRLCLATLEGLPLTGARVLDLGCGTGVLGLVALLLGAAHVTFTDVEPWAIDNTAENLVRNQLDPARATILLGEASVIPPGQFDLILANLNRNLLLAHAGFFAQRLAPSGSLVTSGYFDLDGPQIVRNFSDHALLCQATSDESNWLCQRFTRG